MSKTRIEWVKNLDGTQGYTINPVKGLCPMACDYCYARRMYKRFKWNPEIRMDDLEVEKIKNPSRIFVGSTMELFGDWIPKFWFDSILNVVKGNPQHIFIFLTKQPQNLPKEFPNNCWVGVSATNQKMHREAIYWLSQIKALVKFISYEPLLSEIIINGGYDLSGHDDFKEAGISWAIIGQETPVRKSTMPKKEWIKEIAEACDKTNIPAFLKYNLVGSIPIEEPFYKHTKEGWAIRQGIPLDRHPS